MIDIKNIETIYFIGIGGIAMSATAGIAKDLGFHVLGSDAKSVYAPARDVLDRYDIEYFIGYDKQNIIDNPADIYVLSAGEDQNNPEVAYITEQDLPYVSFSELLYELSKEKLRIVVAGTHGKSTTAGLMGSMLKDIDDSSFMIGAVLQKEQTNFHKGEGHYFVFEGDEYKATFDDPTPKFHFYKPDILTLTNIEFDHPDVFSTLEEILDEFRELIRVMPADGLVIYNADDIHASKLAFDTNIASLSFGIDHDADFRATEIEYNSQGTTFIVIDNNNPDHLKPEKYEIALPGKINIYNALACIATLRTLGFPQELFSDTLTSYTGVKRRFEIIGTVNDITIIDDYAHHPTAVRETLEAARTKYPDARIWAIFEPHTFSRTKATLPELKQSFNKADRVLIAEIYPARESTSNPVIKSQEVVDAIKQNHGDVNYVSDKHEALNLLRKESKPGDVIIVMAVGSFNKLAYELMAILNK